MLISMLCMILTPVSRKDEIVISVTENITKYCEERNLKHPDFDR